MPVFGRTSNYAPRSWRRIDTHLAVQLIGQRELQRKPGAKTSAVVAYRRRRMRPGLLIDVRV